MTRILKSLIMTITLLLNMFDCLLSNEIKFLFNSEVIMSYSSNCYYCYTPVVLSLIVKRHSIDLVMEDSDINTLKC